MARLKMETFTNGLVAANCSIVWDPDTMDAIVIDPGDDSKTVIEAIRKKNLNVKYLLHTHAHFDHIGESKQIKDELDTPIYLHKDEAPVYEQMAQQGLMFGVQLSEPGEVDHYFTDGEQLGFSPDDNSTIFTVIHTPGHSPGGAAFYSEAFEGGPVLFSGDTLFMGSIGRTDLPGGNHETLMTSIREKIYTLDPNTTVVCGHGPNTSVGHEMKTNPFVRA